jgi:hypothetical protein
MPFTISHTAAVLPFARFLKGRSLLSAALIGSMVPDFGMFMPWHPLRAETHSVVALATFCLPVGLAAFWVFQYVVKPALIAVLPDNHYRIAAAFARPVPIGRLRTWLAAAIGLLLGALTHLSWDAFTHEGARGMRMIPALDELAIVAGGHHVAGQRLLQDVSSLIGLAIIAWWWLRALRPARPTHADPGPRLLSGGERLRWLCAYALVAVLVTLAVVAAMRSAQPGRLSLGNVTNDIAIAALRGLAASLVAVSLALMPRLRFLMTR